MTAVDDADPNRAATADVTILVERNAHAPRFTEPEYRLELAENAALGEPVVTVRAVDDDGVSQLPARSTSRIDRRVVPSSPSCRLLTGQAALLAGRRRRGPGILLRQPRHRKCVHQNTSVTNGHWCFHGKHLL